MSVTYDNIGNRNIVTNNSETTQYQANSLNQYTNITDGVTNSPTYDADGNMLSNGEWTYAWNGENRLVTASNGTVVVSFGYDYMGRRYSKTVDGDETAFVYNGWNMVRESSSTETNHYVWGLDLSQSLQGAGGVGGLLSVTEDDGNSYYPSIDANGNITGYLNSTGGVVAVYVYDAFGGILASSGAKVDNFKFRFSSKYEDETGLNYYGYRYYDAEMGRWLNRDKAEERGGINLYDFVFNDVLNGTDYLGLFFEPYKTDTYKRTVQIMIRIMTEIYTSTCVVSECEECEDEDCTWEFTRNDFREDWLRRRTDTQYHKYYKRLIWEALKNTVDYVSEGVV